MISDHARSRGLVVVTGNLQEFTLVNSPRIGWETNVGSEMPALKYQQATNELPIKIYNFFDKRQENTGSETIFPAPDGCSLVMSL